MGKSIIRKKFVKSAIVVALLSTLGCGYLRIDPMHVLIRSDNIKSLAEEEAILKKARLSRTEDGKIQVLFVSGTPYERGYQHGALLREQVQDNLTSLYDGLKSRYHFEELFAEAFERMRPFIPEEYMQEMHGLAHGSKLPLHIIHAIHAIPSITEWGGKKEISKTVNMMMDGSLATSCSNFAFTGAASADGNLYSVRVLDWGIYRLSRLHQYPLITINLPEHGIPFANIGWVGFLGAVSGMNAKGITLGEKGYGDPAGETLRGMPMPFLLRDVLSKASNLRDVRKILQGAQGDCSYVFLMSDGKDGSAELYIKDRYRFKSFKLGAPIRDGKKDLPAIPNTIWDGHYENVLEQELTQNLGRLSPQLVTQEMLAKIAMPGNFQNVIYDPKHLRFWVNNAKSLSERAAEQPMTLFDLRKELLELQQQDLF